MFLERILARKREEVARAAAASPEAELRARAAAAPPPRDFAAALAAPGLKLIAEFKRASPSAGWIAQEADPAAVAREYAAGGAAALSVLTDESFFRGSLEDLARARAAVGLPVLRKDFLIAPRQVAEARAAGADAVLLIAAALPGDGLARLLAEAEAWSLAALVEVHDRAELERTLAAGARLVGVNNRDLRTFRVDLQTTLDLAALVPPACLLVSESGIRDPADVQRLAAAGVRAILVGEALMRAADRPRAARELLGR